VTEALRRSFISLQIPNYRRYFAGQLVSLSGNWMQVVAEVWLILSLTGSGVAVGITTALQFLPMLLAGAWGGALADRVDKRRLLIVTQALMALPALVLWAVTAGGAVEPWMVFALVFARGAVNAFDNPSRQSFVIEMVGSRRVVSAVGLNSVLIHSARILGPAAAGVAIATVGVAPCFLLNAASFGAMIVALRGMDRAQLRTPAPTGDTEDGVRAAIAYVARTPSLAIPLAMMALVGTFGFNFQVILPLLARFAFDGGATAYTALAVAMGAGSVGGALATGARGRVSPPFLVATALAFGALAALAAAAPTLELAVMALVPLGAASVAFAAGVNSTLQLTAHPQMRGRVMALYSVVFLGTTPIGGPIAGALAQVAGPRASLLLSASAALAAGLGAWLAFARLGRVPAPADLLDGGRWRSLGRGRPVAVEAGGANQPQRLERGGGLHVEPHTVALLDGRHRSLAATPRECDQDRVAGANRGDLRPHPGQATDDQRKCADGPQPQKRDPAGALRRQAGRRAGARQDAGDRLGRTTSATEPETNRRGHQPPPRRDDESDTVGVAVGDHDADGAQHRRHRRDEQHGHPQQVAEQHQASEESSSTNSSVPATMRSACSASAAGASSEPTPTQTAASRRSEERIQRRARNASRSVTSSPPYIARPVPASRSRRVTVAPLSIPATGRSSSTFRPQRGTRPEA
jgi:MFS family permease